MKNYRIVITGAPGNYSGAGAANIVASKNPILDAARSLLKHGAPPAAKQYKFRNVADAANARQTQKANPMSKISNPASPGAPSQVDSAGSVTHLNGGSFPALDITFDAARIVTRMTEIAARIDLPAGAGRPGRDTGTNRENG